MFPVCPVKLALSYEELMSCFFSLPQLRSSVYLHPTKDDLAGKRKIHTRLTQKLEHIEAGIWSSVSDKKLRRLKSPHFLVHLPAHACQYR